MKTSSYEDSSAELVDNTSLSPFTKSGFQLNLSPKSNVVLYSLVVPPQKFNIPILVPDNSALWVTPDTGQGVLETKYDGSTLLPYSLCYVRNPDNLSFSNTADANLRLTILQITSPDLPKRSDLPDLVHFEGNLTNGVTWSGQWVKGLEDVTVHAGRNLQHLLNVPGEEAMHYHEESYEIYDMRSSVGKMMTALGLRSYRPYETFVFPPQTLHGFGGASTTADENHIFYGLNWKIPRDIRKAVDPKDKIVA